MDPKKTSISFPMFWVEGPKGRHVPMTWLKLGKTTGAEALKLLTKLEKYDGEKVRSVIVYHGVDAKKDEIEGIMKAYQKAGIKTFEVTVNDVVTEGVIFAHLSDRHLGTSATDQLETIDELSFKARYIDQLITNKTLGKLYQEFVMAKLDYEDRNKI